MASQYKSEKVVKFGKQNWLNRLQMIQFEQTSHLAALIFGGIVQFRLSVRESFSSIAYRLIVNSRFTETQFLHCVFDESRFSERKSFYSYLSWFISASETQFLTERIITQPHSKYAATVLCPSPIELCNLCGTLYRIFAWVDFKRCWIWNRPLAAQN